METLLKTWETLPNWLQALPLLFLGYLLAHSLRWLTTQVLGLLRFDLACERAGLAEFMRKGQVAYVPSKLAGLFVFWIVLGGTFMKAARLLDLDLALALSTRLQEFIPGLIAALLLGILGFVLVFFLGNLVGTIIRNAGYSHAELLTQGVKLGGGLLVLAISLEQVSFGKTLLTPLIQIFFAALAFGVALAFGLGCKDLAKDFALKLLAALRERSRAASKSDLEG